MLGGKGGLILCLIGGKGGSDFKCAGRGYVLCMLRGGEGGISCMLEDWRGCYYLCFTCVGTGVGWGWG